VRGTANRLKIVGAEQPIVDNDDPFVSQPTEPARSLAQTIVPGYRIGPYQVTKLLGAGGMAAVYAGVELPRNRKVAIKILDAGLSRDSTVVRRFMQEAHAVNQIRHPNVVEIFALGQLPTGQPYIVMEFLRGQTLASRLDKLPSPRVREAFRILIEVCEALAAAHDRGIVHRDVKPDNIFLTDAVDGGCTVKLLDFGMAKLQGSTVGFDQPQTGVGISLGTPLYMAPEQCRGEAVDARTDVYALGVILFEMFTGEHPFVRPTLREILDAQLRQLPPRSEALARLPAELVDLTLACLRKDPDARPSGVRALRDQLQAIAGRRGFSFAKRIAAHTAVGLAPTLEGKTCVQPVPRGRVLAPRRRAPLLVAALVLALAGALLWEPARAALASFAPRARAAQMRHADERGAVPEAMLPLNQGPRRR
jgi:serine/threonine-protein kinase